MDDEALARIRRKFGYSDLAEVQVVEDEAQAVDKDGACPQE